MKKDIKNVGFVLRPSTPKLKEDFYKLKELFISHGVGVYIDSISGGMIGVMGMQFELLCEKCDILVSLGGDGTLISTVRRSFEHNIPVLGIHAGNLGFLADVSIEEVESFIPKLLAGEVRMDERAVLEVKLVKNQHEIYMYAFNDVVLTRPSISNMIHIETLVDKKPFNTYYGDGVIVATPTGSTAYNLSAGGPVLFPLTDVFALTPICPHSLTQRPVVLPGTFSIEMKTPENRATLIIDGQDMHEIGVDDSIHIKLSSKKANLIHREAFNYFDVLKQKLSWGE
ncbi:MAG: NAD(+)/NADH kinase [Sulfurimonas sp.]|nr:NAD(+)/NADH kinase [Sulfurimonas sp.]